MAGGRRELAKLEAEQAERNEEITSKRLALLWVPVEKEHEFDTEDGKKTLAELFDGRSQLLATTSCSGPTTARRLRGRTSWPTGSTARSSI